MFFKHKLQLPELLLQSVRVILFSFLFLYPLFFLPFTLDVFDLNKQTLLLLCTFVAALLWTGSILAKRSTTLRLSWIQILPVIIVVVFTASSWKSLAPYASIVGSMGTEYVSVVTMLALAILFFLFTQTISTDDDQKIIFPITLSSSVIVGLIGILSIFGVNIIPFLTSTISNTVGTVNSLAIFLVAMSAFATIRFVSQAMGGVPRPRIAIAMNLLVLLLNLETLFLALVLDFWIVWSVLILANVLIVIFFLIRPKEFPSILKMCLPVTMIVISIPFLLWMHSPFNANLPLEVSPNFAASFEIVKTIFTNPLTALLGTGGGTYVFDFAQYHGTNINQTNFWNTRFDHGTSFFMTMLPEVGIIGTLAYLIFLSAICVSSILFLVRTKKREEWLQTVLLFCPWLVLVVAAFLAPFNLTLIIALFLLSAMLTARILSKEKTVSFADSTTLAFGSSTLFIVFTLALFIGIFLTTGRYSAEIAYAKAVRADRSHVDTKSIVALLDQAATLNQYDDAAYRNLAEALLLRVTDELQATSSNSQLNDQSKQYIQSLVAASVNAAVHATDLSPNNVTNWLVRGEVYRSLINLVPDAAKFSKEAYTQSTKLEPNNPDHFVELGKTDMAIADAAQTLAGSKDPKVVEQAKTDSANALVDAEKAFSKAIALKSNYDPAHFQLGLLYEREGKFAEAISKIESVAKYNNSDVGVAFELGVLYLKRNGTDDLARAENAFVHAITLSPTYSNAHWYLASVYEKEQKLDQAISEVQTVLKLNPGNQIVQTRLTQLKAGTPTVVAPAAVDSLRK